MSSHGVGPLEPESLTPAALAGGADATAAPDLPTAGPTESVGHPLDSAHRRQRRAREELLNRLGALEPRYGWSDASQIPELTDEDVATVLAEADDLLADAVCDMTFNTVLTAQLKSQEGTIHRYSLIGAALVHELEVLARHYLIGELRARADSEADQRAKDWRDFAADDAGVPRQGEI